MYLSVLKLQIENKNVSAMDYFTLFLFGHCLILPTYNYLQRKIDHQGKLKCNLKPEKKFL